MSLGETRKANSPWGQGPRRLVELLSDERSPGFDAFMEVVSFATPLEELGAIEPDVAAYLRCFELISVAAVEAAERERAMHGREMDMAALHVADACAQAAACVIVQCYSAKGLRGPVRRLVRQRMIKQFNGFLDLALKHAEDDDGEGGGFPSSPARAEGSRQRGRRMP